MIDFHLHSKFSHDGHQKLNTIIETAAAKGFTHIAVTDHCDWDYLFLKGYWYERQIKLKKYLKTLKAIAADSPISVAVGIELGYHALATKKYLSEMPFDELDYVINSAHSADGDDAYFPSFFRKKERDYAYKLYLDAVEESLEAPYPYCTISHIGYVAKNAPYENPVFLYSDHAEQLDRILKRIIELDKTLEINSNIKVQNFMPHESIVERYVELGGKKVIFGSDAHRTPRIGEGYKEAETLVKSLGISEWAIYKNLEPVTVKIPD